MSGWMRPGVRSSCSSASSGGSGAERAVKPLSCENERCGVFFVFVIKMVYFFSLWRLFSAALRGCSPASAVSAESQQRVMLYPFKRRQWENVNCFVATKVTKRMSRKV